MSMQEDNRPGRPTTHTTPAGAPRATTSRMPVQENDMASDLMVAPAGWRLSWGAVFAGVIVALVTQLILNLLGLGVGLAGAPAASTSTGSMEWFGTGLGIWWAITGIIAAAVGGWFAGRTLGSGDRNDGMIHGLLSWAGATLVVAFLLTTAMGGALGVQPIQQQALAPLGQAGQQVFGQAGQGGQGAGGAPSGQPAQPGAEQQPGAPPPAGGQPALTPQQQQQAQRAVGAISGAAIASFIALLIGAAAAASAGRAGVSAARRALRE